jgi:O-antigen ligase
MSRPSAEEESTKDTKKHEAITFVSLRVSSWILPSLSLLFNLPFVLFHVQRNAYDAYTHIFFADHYQRAWWNLWEPRWYLGFSVASYPPLTHQLIALLGWPLTALIQFFAPGPEPYPGAFRWLGLESAFVVVLLTALALFPLAVRALARLFVGPRAADMAALCAIALPALNLSAWAFGQLPTIAATVAVLFALTRGALFLRAGRRLHLLQAVALAALAAALHHGVFLFIPFLGLAVISRQWSAVSGQQSAVSNQQSAINNRQSFILHTSSFILFSALAVALVLWPFLLWSRGQSLQTPIDHASRHNFLTDQTARMFFFWPMYGPLLILIPAAVRLGWRRRLWPLLTACAALFVLGLGGTTPLPAFLFGAGWQWLTYDRFSFWAAILLLPFAGVVLTRVARLGFQDANKLPPRALSSQRISTIPSALSVFSAVNLRRWLTLAFLAALIASGSLAGWWAVLGHTQPPALDLAPIVRFLNAPEQQPYRYLTLGFGDQFAKLSALTTNGSPDGDYHTARSLPELRASGLGALDTARWIPNGLAALTPLLAHPEKYGLRWVFVNHPDYTSVLTATGWQFRFYVGEVAAWEWSNGSSLAVAEPSGQRDSLTAFWWGSVPLATLVLAALSLSWGAFRIRRESFIAALRFLRRAGWMTTTLLLMLWWFHPLYTRPHPFMYFTYRSVLLFASDVVLALSLCLWLAERALRREPLRVGPRAVAWGGAMLILASALSILFAQDKVIALAFTAHLILLAVFYLALINDAPGPAWWGRVFAVMLFASALLAGLQVMEQRTQAMNLPWPGALAAADKGASIVSNAAGARWLRAYGTLPHPNILGGALIVLLGAMAERYAATGQRRWWLIAAPGWLALWLTFSRAAWLGAGVMLIAIAVGSKRKAPLRASSCFFVDSLPFISTALLTFALTLAMLWPFFFSRAASAADRPPLEQRSLNERWGLLRSSLTLIAQHPLTGVGAGNFVIALDAVRPDGVPWEPVHNLILLITAELGVPGLLALTVFVGAVLWQMWQRRRVTAWGAVLLGVMAVAMFDHFWWTMAPMRTLLIIAVALWAKENDPRENGSLSAPAATRTRASTSGG